METKDFLRALLMACDPWRGGQGPLLALQPGPWGSHCPGQAGMGPGSQCCVLLTWPQGTGALLEEQGRV